MELGTLDMFVMGVRKAGVMVQGAYSTFNPAFEVMLTKLDRRWRSMGHRAELKNHDKLRFTGRRKAESLSATRDIL